MVIIGLQIDILFISHMILSCVSMLFIIFALTIVDCNGDGLQGRMCRMEIRGWCRCVGFLKLRTDGSMPFGVSRPLNVKEEVKTIALFVMRTCFQNRIIFILILSY